MLQYLLLLFLYGVQTSRSEDSGSDSDFGGNLVSLLRNDANLDLSVDEDYEDLRAELLAYHTALASMPSRQGGSTLRNFNPETSPHHTAAVFWFEERGIGDIVIYKNFDRLTLGSLISTPCWALGGICINHKLCSGHKYLAEVPGCKDKLNVCCFAWNRFQVRDMRDKGIGNVAFPWSLQTDFGGEGIVDTNKNQRGKLKTGNKTKAIALLLKSNKVFVI